MLPITRIEERGARRGEFVLLAKVPEKKSVGFAIAHLSREEDFFLEEQFPDAVIRLLPIHRHQRFCFSISISSSYRCLIKSKG